MIILRHCFACQLHCYCIDSGLQLHVVLLTKIMLTEHSQFLKFFLQLLTKKRKSSPFSARFYFAKYKIFPVNRNNVNLTNSEAVITFKNAVSLALSKNHRQSFLSFFLCTAVHLSKQISL